jgi:hypothetical protein
VRRVVAWLAGIGVVTLAVAVPLWHVERPDTSGCGASLPCVPRMSLPYGGLAATLTVIGAAAIVAAAVLLLLLLLAFVRNADARSVRGVRGDLEEPPSS